MDLIFEHGRDDIECSIFKSPEITWFMAVAEVSELRPAASAAARNERLATSDRIASKVATPMRIPMKRVVLARPEAMPERSGGTDVLKTLTVSPFRMPAPDPATNIPITKKR